MGSAYGTRELADLSEALDPDERARLESRLRELEPAAGGAGRGSLRELIQAQLRVMDELEARRASLAGSYERIDRGLRQLWLQLGSLRGRDLGAGLSEAEITRRIRAICLDLELQDAAAAEVDDLLAPRAATQL